eukprot:SM000014S00314  [mRNA]  locus=s14:682909:684964:- [translate_table: standard]
MAAAAAANAGGRGTEETAEVSSSPRCRLLKDVAIDSHEHSASVTEPPAVEPSRPPPSAVLPPLSELPLLGDDTDWGCCGAEYGSVVELGATPLMPPPELSAEALAGVNDSGESVGLLEDPGAGVSASLAGAWSTSEAPAGVAKAAPTAGERAQEERSCGGTSPPSPKRHKLRREAAEAEAAAGAAATPDSQVQVAGWPARDAWGPGTPRPCSPRRARSLAMLLPPEGDTGRLLAAEQQGWASTSAGNAGRGAEPSNVANACEHDLRGDQEVVDGDGEQKQVETVIATAGGSGSAGGHGQSPLAAVGEVGSTAHPVAAASAAAGPAATKRRRGRPPGRKRAGTADTDCAASAPEATSSDTLKLLGDLKYLLKAALHSKQAEAAARLTMYCLRSSVVAERDMGPAGAREALTAMTLASPGSFLARGAANLLEVWQP